MLPEGSLLVFNNTKVVRARLIMHKGTGARVEVFCLEPHAPADYERAFAQKGSCSWSCIVGNLKKWKDGAVEIPFQWNSKDYLLQAFISERGTREHVVRFEWNADITFGQLLEHLGKIPIPPYLNRESQQIDNTRYQTVYSVFEGSVAAPTAGLHFTRELMEQMQAQGFGFEGVTLHVGAGTFLPVKDENAARHPMHTEHFEVKLETLLRLREKYGHIVAVGTTSVRTLESLPVLAWRIHCQNDPHTELTIGQWEAYAIEPSYSGENALDDLISYMEQIGVKSIKAATQIMITPLGFKFRIVRNIITNFHQPKSTLILLVSSYLKGDWRRVYEYALNHDFRFLSYGDSSLLMCD